MPDPTQGGSGEGRMDRLMRFCLDNKLLVVLLVLFLGAWGVMTAPFDWDLHGLNRSPVPVDAIPDTGENQQIVFSRWPGRSPQDIEDQVTYPLTVSLLGLPGVQTIRSNSFLGFSSIFVIFKEDVDFYWSRSRILEKLSSLPAGTLPEGVQPALGPDATPLGQVFWYTLEGRDPQGKPTGGWDLEELRTIQDWNVRYALSAVDGVAEVSSIGGFVREYQIDVDPDALRFYGVNLGQVFQAVRDSNVDVGARTIEVNKAEYMIRGLGFLKGIADIEETVVGVHDNTPVLIKHVAKVSKGPALRRGALDKGGAEAVGGVVVVRYGANPMAVIQRVHEEIDRIASGLPSKTLEDGTRSQVTVVPFYDRTGLIQETLGTLDHALSQEILVTIIVVLVMVAHFRSALLIAGLLPLAVLMCFIAMKHFGVDANIVALSGIAIAIGTMVDMGVVLTENILKHIRDEDDPAGRKQAILTGASEVGGAVLTAVLTTIVSFLPVFTMEGAEGKLFRPLAFTKTFALLASIIVALIVIPPMAHVLLGKARRSLALGLVMTMYVVAALLAFVYLPWWVGGTLCVLALWRLFSPRLPSGLHRVLVRSTTLVVACILVAFLADAWKPLGPMHPWANLGFALVLLGGSLAFFWGFQRIYEPILRFCLRFKLLFLMVPVLLVAVGAFAWLGAERFLGKPPMVEWKATARMGEEPPLRLRVWKGLTDTFPGFGKEFMPPLDEGSFLLMPVTMAHASIGESLAMLQEQDMLIRAIPEVESVVGKIGRVESPLDPAPVSMVETVINYKSEYRVDAKGDPIRYAYDEDKGEYRLDADHELVPDPEGRPFRQWRDHIRSPGDIWDEIAKAAQIPGMTTASMLQPIETRRIMLSTGMRAPMGIKVRGPDLQSLEKAALALEQLLKKVPSVRPATVVADRVVGKPYLEIEIDRKAIARYGISVRRVQDVIEVAIGGKGITTTVEGRERFPVRVRYQRELRDSIESLGGILVPAPDGTQIPLGQLADIRYTPGPQVIKSEDTFLTAYVIFDKKPGKAEVDVVEDCTRFLESEIDRGALTLPSGVTWRFAGNYEAEVRASQKLMIVLPLSLFVIFLILYLQFRSVSTTMIVFSGVFVAWSGGFLMLWLYAQPWFLDVSILGASMRDLFQVHPINLSVAVWVGFLALFGIATDDGVIISTYLDQTFERRRPSTRDEIREAVVLAGKRRIRPCLMTSATTILALIPVLTSSGRGSDVMVPMAIPSFGGMSVVIITVFVVPTLYCLVAELRLRRDSRIRSTESNSEASS